MKYFRLVIRFGSNKLLITISYWLTRGKREVREVKTMKRNRSICWIDYKKVYIANVYCNNIGMEFGLDKGVVLEMK